MTSRASCIILAGGLGTRLREAVPDRPKCLAPIGGRSFLSIQLHLLIEQGFDDFILSLGHLAEMVTAEVASLNLPCQIRTTVEDRPLGTGGAMLKAMQDWQLDEALVTNGDTFLGGSLLTMQTPLQVADGERVRLAVIDVADRGRFGGVRVQQSRVRGFTEKGQIGPGPINAGLYRVHRTAFGDAEPGQAFSFETQVLPRQVEAGAVWAAGISGEFTDIGVPEDYRRFCLRHG